LLLLHHTAERSKASERRRTIMSVAADAMDGGMSARRVLRPVFT